MPKSTKSKKQTAKQWEPILIVKPTSGASAETMAAYVAAIINQHQGKRDVMQAALTALEAIIDEGLNFGTEQDADLVIEQLKKLK